MRNIKPLAGAGGFLLSVDEQIRARGDYQDAHDSLEREGRDVLEQIRPVNAAHDGAQNQKTCPYPVKIVLIFKNTCFLSTSYDDYRMFHCNYGHLRIRLVFRRFICRKFIEKRREFIDIYRIVSAFLSIFLRRFLRNQSRLRKKRLTRVRSERLSTDRSQSRPMPNRRFHFLPSSKCREHLSARAKFSPIPTKIR